MPFLGAGGNTIGGQVFFSYISAKIYDLGFKKNRLYERILLSIQNLLLGCFYSKGIVF